MAQPIEERLRRLSDRRKGLDRLSDLSFTDQATVLAKGMVSEDWQSREAQKKHTQYTLGAMQSVGSEYTEITLETARRVGRQIESNLTPKPEFRLQGSVPLDIHIRGVSDVDLLVLDNSFFVFHPSGRLANSYAPSQRNQLDVILELRTASEKILKNAYPAAKVDCSGSKAIKLSGGSLPRPVDVVPAIWYRTVEYQNSLNECDAGVTVADKSVPKTIDNFPFLHIKLINDRDLVCAGGLKKLIRLAKNIKADSDRAALKKLSSFDIASFMYHADQNNLYLGQFFELSVLAELRRFLDWAYFHEVEARAFRTPDGTRYVLDSKEKFEAIKEFSYEVDELARRVAVEQQALADQTNWGDIAKALKETRLR